MKTIAILLALLISTPAHATKRCNDFSYYDYQELTRYVQDPADTPTAEERSDMAIAVDVALGCPGQEIARVGDSRSVLYRAPDGGTIIIVWHGNVLAGLSQRGLAFAP